MGIRPLIFGLLAGLAALALPLHAAPTPAPKPKTTQKKTAPKKKPAPRPTPAPMVLEWDANGVPITHAASVVVADAETYRVLYEKNATEIRQPASTQKLLTALLVAEAGNLDRKLVIQPGDTHVEPTKLGFKPGDVYTRRELLRVMLVHSVNDAAVALARDNAGSVEAFSRKMNARARELGMRNSHFVNPNGLPDPAQYSTARDMARLALAAGRNSTIRSMVSTKEVDFRYSDGRVRKFKNTNLILRDNPACTGMKTGYTKASGHCLISSATQNGRTVIVVVLGEQKRNRMWFDSDNLLAWGLRAPRSLP